MCAIFGFIAEPSHSSRPGPRLRVLEAIVRGNAARGPHAFGFSWIDGGGGGGRLRMFKQTGRLVDRLGVLRMLAGARLVVGHLRYATHGDARDNANNHPHPCDGGWLVHNGVIRNHAALARQRDLCPITACDSEVLARLVETVDADDGATAGTSRLRRVASAAALCEGPLAALALWSRPAGLVAVRRGNPLSVASAAEGVYLATLPDGLPDDAYRPHAVRDNSAWLLAPRGGEIVTRRLALPAPADDGWHFSPATAGRAYRGG